MIHRSMMQVYVRESNKAVELYQKAFDAEIVANFANLDGTYMHAELNVYGQILAVSEAPVGEGVITGTAMQFCLHFGEGKEELVKKAYDILKDNAKINYPLSTCSYSPLMTDLTDKYGVRWCLFV